MLEAIVELEAIKRPKLIINNDIDDSKVMFPKKLKQANEVLEKSPLPAEMLLKRYSKLQQEEGIKVSGILKRANALANTFLVIEMRGSYEVHFNIHTSSEILNQLVKKHWGETINVHVRPQINKENQFEYEFIEIK